MVWNEAHIGMVETMLAHFLGFEFLMRNEENILLSHEKRGKEVSGY